MLKAQRTDSAMSLDEFLIHLAHENPALVTANRREAFAELFRRQAPHDHLVALLVLALSFKWKLFFPPKVVPIGGRKHHASTYATAQARQEMQRERARFLANIGPETMMIDGRPLGDWTIGDLRKVGGLFTFILDRAGTKDDERLVRSVMRPIDWSKAKPKGEML